jgi:hypothetical protein
MTVVRRSLTAVRDLVVAIIRPFVPEPGTTEGAVMLGLVLLAAGFLVADLAPLALIVPGTVLVLVGLAPVVAAVKRGA